tara:strand:+ start:322 stop:1362 length:1041 start_codon:yes stop_codon:yes gene_type:complete
MSNTIHSFGFGLATTNSAGEIIEVYYPEPRISPSPQLTQALSEICKLEEDANVVLELNPDTAKLLIGSFKGIGETSLATTLEALANGKDPITACISCLDAAPASIPEAFLKLHLLSHRLAKPHSLNLQGIFTVLRNLAWTNQGPIDLNDLPVRQLQTRLSGEVLDVHSIDKFPKMTSYVVPSGVRIADTARIRLGAYIGEGTTVMHEGFVNFNAGTLGNAMIEGRISSGVVIGENSDLGGGCSTMGALSGGGTEIISVGKNCLIGANAGIGFPLADGCIIEAGLYVTAGTKVNLLDNRGELIKTAKAKDISEIKNHVYRRNSLTGTVECVPSTRAASLNEELHSHN